MACKDKTTGTWVAQWYEVDMYGKKKRRKKRGFKTMREAKLYESERTLKEQGDMNMLLKDFMEQYFEDKQNELVVNGRFCPQSVRNFCPIVAGFNAGTYKVPACVL